MIVGRRGGEEDVEDLISHRRKEIKRTSAVIRSNVACMGGGKRQDQ